MAAPLNNARLLSFAAYEDLQGGFARLFRTAGGNWREFFERARELGDRPKAARHAALASDRGADGKKPTKIANVGLISYIQSHSAAPCFGDATPDPHHRGGPATAGALPSRRVLCCPAAAPARPALEEVVMAEIVSEAEPRALPAQRPLRPWLAAGQTLAQWLASLEDEPPPGEDMLPMIAPHAVAMRHSADALEQRYRGQRVEVGFDMPVVFRLPDEHGLQVKGRLSPDVFVALGVKRDPARRDYDATVLKPPDFLLEVLSKSTWKRDAGPKLEAYALVGVRECFLFDPVGEHLAPPAVRGFALSKAGARPLPEVALPDGVVGVRSEVLDLVAHVAAADAQAEGQGRVHALRWRDPRTDEDLPTHAEEAAARVAAEQRAAAAEARNGELERRNRELEALLRQSRRG